MRIHHRHRIPDTADQFLSSLAQDFIEDSERIDSIYEKFTEFLSSLAQDFIEEWISTCYYWSTWKFLSSLAQDFIEEIASQHISMNSRNS